ncbi:unnamed protein product [marine sediment metagenome]|uniref:Uncharacterized protein n=1 Tax=marine sediment metagenome TaxID=412755 RepID=X0YEZ9_9ZZZZ
MPWMECSTVSERETFVRLSGCGANVSVLATHKPCVVLRKSP